MPLVALPVSSSGPPASMIPAFAPIAANIMSQGICEGNVCKVQVCTYGYLLHIFFFHFSRLIIFILNNARIGFNIQLFSIPSVFLQAIVTYESGKKCGDLPPELHRLGKALAQGSNLKALADAAMESPNLKEAIVNRLCSDISKECKTLCSMANPSPLRGITKELMVNFSW